MIISEYKKIEGAGALSASFNLTLPKWAGFEIRGLTLFETNGKRWINMPSRTYEDPQEPGKKKYSAHCRFPDRDVNDRFLATIMAALDQHVKTLVPSVHAPASGIAKGTFAAKDLDDELPF